MSGIFISYRRDDSAGHAGRLYDRLSDCFGADKLFMDVDTIRPGEEFPEVIDRKIATCNVLLAVIGNRWLAATDAAGKRRLEDPGDFVRLEIQNALDRGMRVIPVLVSGARMPRAEDLPDDLNRLARLQAIEISDAGFREDASRLVELLQETVAPAGAKRKRAKKYALRSEPATLSPDEVKAMLATHGYYCKGWNAAGKGIEHDYQTMVSAGAVVVADKATGLMWQKGGSDSGMIFEETNQYVAGLNERKYAGFENWRVPTLEEAMSLMTAEERGGHHLDAAFESSVVIMWTADRHSREGGGWIIYFYNGICAGESVNYNGDVRAVRSMERPKRGRSAK